MQHLEVCLDKNTKILIIDDFSTMRQIIRNLLNDIGYQRISEADDGLTALSLLKAERFNFVIADYAIPGLQGVELLKAIRHNEKLANIPVLMIFANQRKDKIVEAARAGVNGYIVKPFTAITLSEKIQKIASRESVSS
jgi:two-component system chemotaxis response regulator CheY